MLCNLWLPSEGFWWLLEVSQNVWVILVFVNLQKGSCELLPPSKYMYLRLPSVGMSVFHLTSDIFVVVWVGVSNLHWSYKITVLHVSPSEPSNFFKMYNYILMKETSLTCEHEKGKCTKPTEKKTGPTLSDMISFAFWLCKPKLSGSLHLARQQYGGNSTNMQLQYNVPLTVNT